VNVRNSACDFECDRLAAVTDLTCVAVGLWPEPGPSGLPTASAASSSLRAARAASAMTCSSQMGASRREGQAQRDRRWQPRRQRRRVLSRLGPALSSIDGLHGPAARSRPEAPFVSAARSRRGPRARQSPGRCVAVHVLQSWRGWRLRVSGTFRSPVRRIFRRGRAGTRSCSPTPTPQSLPPRRGGSRPPRRRRPTARARGAPAGTATC
jgi:hypothetical protein